MIDYHAFALAVITVGAVATAGVIAPAIWRWGDGETLFRESTGEIVTRQPPRGGSLNIESTPQCEIDAAAERVNAPDSARTKRLLDITLSLGVLLFCFPILLLTAIVIKLSSDGSVFYRQRRVGLGGAEFDLLKFRSMVSNAEQNGPQYASVNDSRITPVGRIIRKFRIDEIPQTINVLRGEMSFVGPRPERPEFVRDLETEIPLYQCRHLVKPGITGWAQVKYEYAASIEGARNKLRYDLYYIRHFSPVLDLVIVLMTVRVALFGLGSR
ncbi:sugar transferase [Hyphococcus sp.]|uniref:sugar transferase n=1 Tax=Hyphococcus sp. TaxID=2038636 RepID=UPI00208D61B3|nr:MAG: hypothetical protein DHS20C04_11610 [Marinicaulis sp.]